MNFSLLYAVALALLCPPLTGQEIKLLPNDGASDDRFGYSVAISGTTAIVGAHWDDDNGSDSGSAYLFDTITGTQIAKLLASDGIDNDQFGAAVDLSDHTAIIGAFGNDDNGADSGSAYLFDISTLGGVQLAILHPSDGVDFDYFGSSVAISGTTAIVGAPGDDDNGEDSGSAYLFDTTTGAQIAKLLPSDGSADDYFGGSVAISGDRAIVGAVWDDDNGSASGSAYVFDATTGAQLAKLIASDGEYQDYFGFSVAISGDTAIVGAFWDDDLGYDSGSAYLFDVSTGAQRAKLVASDGFDGDHFGFSVAISGTTAIIGARWDDDTATNSGSVYLFDTAAQTQITKLTASDGADNDLYGNSVAISGTTVIVGAWADDDHGDNTGSAYLNEICIGHVGSYCVASPNSVSSTGAPISLDGSPSVSSNSMTLQADSLPANQFGVFFCGPLKEDPPAPFGNGFRCVGTSGLSRLNPPVSTGTGTAQRALDLSSSPLSNTQAGDTLHFQLWYRDPVAGGANYNLTDALEVTFCP